MIDPNLVAVRGWARGARQRVVELAGHKGAAGCTIYQARGAAWFAASYSSLGACAVALRAELCPWRMAAEPHESKPKKKGKRKARAPRRKPVQPAPRAPRRA